jgi:predicted nucleotidyltransferase component of viral defense system
LDKESLSPLQSEFLDRFFAHDHQFFLTGGAALVGFYLHHRKTEDLDLFTLKNEIDAGVSLVRRVAAGMDATVEAIQTSPDFRRLMVTRGDSAIVVDLIREYVFQIESEKKILNGIRIDTPEEILANKLCALLSRSEIRDIVDVYALESAGIDLEAALTAAARKDTGFTPAQLAWVLSEIRFDDDLVPPGGISKEELGQYLDKLLHRLSHSGFPPK